MWWRGSFLMEYRSADLKISNLSMPMGYLSSDLTSAKLYFSCKFQCCFSFLPPSTPTSHMIFRNLFYPSSLDRASMMSVKIHTQTHWKRNVCQNSCFNHFLRCAFISRCSLPHLNSCHLKWPWAGDSAQNSGNVFFMKYRIYTWLYCIGCVEKWIAHFWSPFCHDRH